ncbi:MAG: hypothetical protein LBU36_06575 [Clostridiales bacterium]|jgi:hypothetical protein|nr:hypothetical protein [Clostridiales bacterium]
MFDIAIIAGILAALAFLVVFISLCAGGLAFLLKNDKMKVKWKKVRLVSFILFCVFLIGDIVFIRLNAKKVVEGAIDATAYVGGELFGRGVSRGFQSFERNWDKGRLEQLENLSVQSFTVNKPGAAGSLDQNDEARLTKDSDKLTYTIEIVFENDSPAEEKLYFNDLVGNQYLTACDKDDNAYALSLSDSDSHKIPFGRSKFVFYALVPKDAEIDHLRYIKQKIYADQGQAQDQDQ